MTGFAMETAYAHLACLTCSWRGAFANRYACAACGGPLTVAYPPGDRRRDWVGPEPGLWRYHRLLPVPLDAQPVTLGEGATPLLPALHLAREGLLLKNETVNPTASFKDRPVAVATTVARVLGLAGLICASTGNTAVAVGAYAARARLPAVCVVPDAAPPAKLAQIAAVGARIVRVRGTYSDAYTLAQAGAERSGWANLTSTYVNPSMLEGDKTVGYELFEQLGGRAPDWVLVPVGAGPLLAGIDKAFEELWALGLLPGGGPRMVAVQAAGCAPIVRAFEAGSAEVAAWEPGVATTASSIADPLRGYAADGTRTLAVVRRSGGTAVAVSDAEIHDGMLRLAASEGLFVEPGAAAVVAAHRKLEAAGAIRPRDVVVLLLTGHGLKDPQALRLVATTEGIEEEPVLEPGDVAALAGFLERQADG
ncbi:MAG: threonine synthase [Chloroflexota bacterium]|nr:threonine synthase [Chloroflexota bacterium]